LARAGQQLLLNLKKKKSHLGLLQSKKSRKSLPSLMKSLLLLNKLIKRLPKRKNQLLLKRNLLKRHRNLQKLIRLFRRKRMLNLIILW